MWVKLVTGMPDAEVMLTGLQPFPLRMSAALPKGSARAPLKPFAALRIHCEVPCTALSFTEQQLRLGTDIETWQETKRFCSAVEAKGRPTAALGQSCTGYLCWLGEDDLKPSITHARPYGIELIDRAQRPRLRRCRVAPLHLAQAGSWLSVTLV